MRRRDFILATATALPALGLAAAGCSTAEAQTGHVVVHKEATCGCCGIWMQHLQAAGFTTEAFDYDDLSAIKAQYGIAPALQACHTAIIDGYIIEGHVQVGDIQRLLRERPAGRGLATPGMPLGTPGMGMEQGVPMARHNVYLLTESGPIVYASYGA
jgi:hypothetical protein